MKPFRSMKFITKCIFCEISFEEGKDTVVITMGCKSLAEIRYNIPMVSDRDELHAECDMEKLVNFLRSEPKFLMDNLSHFTHGKGLQDLTLKVHGNKLLMKNCATDLLRKGRLILLTFLLKNLMLNPYLFAIYVFKPLSEGKIYTEVTLSTSAFDRFAITEDTEVTFQHKDFKSLISLAEFLKLPVTLHFFGPQE